MIATDLNNLLIEQNSLLSPDFERISFYLRNIRFFGFLQLLKLTAFLQREMLILNKKLIERERIIHDFVNIIFSSKNVPVQDLNNQIDFLNREINKLIDLKESIENFVIKISNRKFIGDFETAALTLKKILDSHYNLLRFYKKVDKKNSIPTSQSTKDVAAHSSANLSKIIDGH